MNLRLLKIISLIEIIGGFIGIILIIKYLSRIFSQPLKSFTVIIITSLFFIILYLLSLIAGILNWKKNNIGRVLSILTQFSQVFYFITNKVSYLYISGIQLGLSIKSSNIINFDYYLGSNFHISLFQNKNEILFGVNIIPLFFMWFLYKNRKKYK